MPIIINEIEISLSVSENPTVTASADGNNASKKEIIKECVEQVLEILRQKNER